MLALIIIAISLSMDAFSLSLAYGTLNIEISKIKKLSLVVGLFHFIMPIVGMNVGKIIVYLLPIKPTTLVSIVLFLIGAEMIIEAFKNEKKLNNLNLFNMLVFAFAVSLDSFTLGLGIEIIYKNPYIASVIFMIFSSFFTFLGLILGKKINDIIGFISTLLGGFSLIIIGLIYLI